MNTTEKIMELADALRWATYHHADSNPEEVTEARVALLSVIETLVADAEKYKWLRDRMQVRYESSMNGGDKRATLSMRIGFGFLDSKKLPDSGWTNPKYFDECRENVDSAIKTAMKDSK